MDREKIKEILMSDASNDEVADELRKLLFADDSGNVLRAFKPGDVIGGKQK